MDYQIEYQRKLTTAREAVKTVRSGVWVDYGWCVATADALDEALAERWQELTNVKVRGGILFKKHAIMQVADVAEHFTWNSWHLSGVEREMVADGSTFYAPMRYSELPRFYRENVEPIQVAMFQVSPMDGQGYFSFGPSASHMAAVCERAEIIIVEVNKNMPRCLGGKENCLHLSKADMIVEGENPPIPQLGSAPRHGSGRGSSQADCRRNSQWRAFSSVSAECPIRWVPSLSSRILRIWVYIQRCTWTLLWI